MDFLTKLQRRLAVFTLLTVTALCAPVEGKAKSSCALNVDELEKSKTLENVKRELLMSATRFRNFYMRASDNEIALYTKDLINGGMSDVELKKLLFGSSHSGGYVSEFRMLAPKQIVYISASCSKDFYLFAVVHFCNDCDQATQTSCARRKKHFEQMFYYNNGAWVPNRFFTLERSDTSECR